MKPLIAFKLSVPKIMFLWAGLQLAFFFSAKNLSAQAPVITKNIGIPMGNASGTGIAYGNNVFVSVFYDGLVYISPDGEVRAKVTDASLPAGVFNRIAFGAGEFVIVGSNGQVLYSADGISWSVATSGTSESFYDIQYLQSKFYAVGNNQTVLTSVDGITWSSVAMGSGTATDQLINITYGNGAFAISARKTSGGSYIYRSTTADANSWSYQNISFNLVNKVQYLKDKFYMFFSSTDVYTSADASTWVNSTTSLPVTLPNSTTQNIGTPNQSFHGIYDGNKFYFFGYSQYHSGYGSIISSTDGVNFTLQNKTVYIVCQGSAYLNDKYFEYGNEGLTYSTDGVNYKYPGGNYMEAASNGSGYVGVGYLGQTGIIFSSPDFNTWTQTSSNTQKELNTVVYNGSQYIAAGNQSVLESANGTTWTQVASLLLILPVWLMAHLYWLREVTQQQTAPHRFFIPPMVLPGTRLLLMIRVVILR